MSDTASERPPIACTLDAADIQTRVAGIAALNARALRGQRREGLVLRLTYAPEAADEVREMVAKEQACCAFLAFVAFEDHAGLHLTITAPEQAREAADSVFEVFATRTSPSNAASCACCGAAA